MSGNPRRRQATFNDSFASEEDALAALKTTLRETVARVDAAIDKLSQDQKLLDQEREELANMQRTVQSNIEDVSRIREELEGSSRRGFCCAPAATTADEVIVGDGRY